MYMINTHSNAIDFLFWRGNDSILITGYKHG